MEGTDVESLAEHDLRDEAGVVMVEYVLLAVFIAMVALIGATALGISLGGLYEAVAGVF